MTKTSEPGELSQLLRQAVLGELDAMDALIRHSCARLTRLTSQMLHGYPKVKRWAETDDVMQNALLRLVRALKEVKPTNARDFLALAALQIRRELIDLARSINGPQGIGPNHDSAPTLEHSDDSHEPCSLAQWTEIHEQIDKLPEDEREVVGLLFYDGLEQSQAAEILGVSVRTVQRRWHNALFKLHRVWKGEDE